MSQSYTPKIPSSGSAGARSDASNETGTDRLQTTAAEAGDRLKTEGRKLKDTMSKSAQDAKSGALQQGEVAKDRAADEVGRTAAALRAAADESDDGSVQHEIFDQAASAVTSISEALNDNSLGEIVDRLSTFGRRNPAVMIGGAVLAGIVVSRFVKASDRNSGGSDRPAERYRASAAPSFDRGRTVDHAPGATRGTMPDRTSPGDFGTTSDPATGGSTT